MASAKVLSVNVGAARTVVWAGREVTSAIWKTPVATRVAVDGVNFRGDDQADRRVHGGHDKAAYSYAMEDYAWWSDELDKELVPGTFGENLTTQGIDLRKCIIGERWHVGSTVLEVAQPRTPCFKLGMRMGDARFVDRFDASGRCGAYLRIIHEGEIGAGDSISVADPPAHGLTVADLVGAQHEVSRDLLELIVGIDDVPDGWRAMARRWLERHRE